LSSSTRERSVLFSIWSSAAREWEVRDLWISEEWVSFSLLCSARSDTSVS